MTSAIYGKNNEEVQDKQYLGKAAKNKVVKGQIHSIHANSEGNVGRVKKVFSQPVALKHCLQANSKQLFQIE